MNPVGRTWVVVLAAGEGARLRTLTTMASGVSVPKQFCSLAGGPSLLEETLRRAAGLVRPKQVCVVVAAQHVQWWEARVRSVPASNVLVQPENRGTAIGMLLPLLEILSRDPDARIVWLPSDHQVLDEHVLAGSIRAALSLSKEASHGCILLGMEPDEADPELGYIVPAARVGAAIAPVQDFVEKPAIDIAQRLIGEGALWNGFIIVVRASALLRVFANRMPQIVREMSAVLAGDQAPTSKSSRLTDLYARLPTIDFSRHIAHGSESDLDVLHVPRCGWSDLGTPARLATALRRMSPSAGSQSANTKRRAALDLSVQKRVVDESRLSG